MSSDPREQTTALEAHFDEAGVAASEYAMHVVHSPDRAAIGRQVQIAGDTDVLSIGRGMPADLQIVDPKLSRLHLRIIFDKRQGQHRLGDAGSANGTFVNGERRDTCALNPTDVVRAGDTLFVYERTDAGGFPDQQTSRAARSALTMLITGETGSGKEVLARWIHEQSGRRGSLVALNCGALSRDLIAAELYGHTRGAFSGAIQARDGLFVAADGGTLFLDEIADLPLDQQPALLRVLQERTVRPVGADREVRVDVRVLAATHADLQARVAAGAFRADLYGRIAQFRVHVPPLRTRRTEIIRIFNQLSAASRRPLVISADVAEALLLWNWPYNVRELEALANRAALVETPHGLDLDELARLNASIASPVLARRREADATEPPLKAHALREELRDLLAKHAGNVTEVARALGKERVQIYRWMKRFGLTSEKDR